MANHGGMVWRTGAALGEDNDEVYGTVLGIDPQEIERLRGEKVI
jgi:hypothetical protein